MANALAPVELVVMMQFADHVNMRFVSRLTSDISRAVQSLIKHFNATVLSASLVFTATGVFLVILTLIINDDS